jgi:hypothetical protein
MHTAHWFLKHIIVLFAMYFPIGEEEAFPKKPNKMFHVKQFARTVREAEEVWTCEGHVRFETSAFTAAPRSPKLGPFFQHREHFRRCVTKLGAEAWTKDSERLGKACQEQRSEIFFDYVGVVGSHCRANSAKSYRGGLLAEASRRVRAGGCIRPLAAGEPPLLCPRERPRVVSYGEFRLFRLGTESESLRLLTRGWRTSAEGWTGNVSRRTSVAV